MILNFVLQNIHDKEKFQNASEQINVCMTRIIKFNITTAYKIIFKLNAYAS